PISSHVPAMAHANRLAGERVGFERSLHGSQFRYNPYPMSIKVIPKKRGRPATGKDPLLSFRAPPELRRDIDKWRKRQPDRPSRSEAIRQLLERGLWAF